MRKSGLREQASVGFEQICVVALVGLFASVGFIHLGTGLRVDVEGRTGESQSRSSRVAGRSEAAVTSLARHALVPLAREVSDWTRHAFAEAVHLDPDSLPTGLRYVDELSDLAGGEAQALEWAATLRAIESSRLDRRANSLRQMKGGRYTKLDVSDIDAELRSGARIDLPLLEGASSIGSAEGRQLLESIAGPKRVVAHPLEGAMRGDVVGTISAWMASSERTFYVPIGDRVVQVKTDMSFHTSSGFVRPMDIATAQHALLTNKVFEDFFERYGRRRPNVDYAREPAALASTDDEFATLIRVGGDGGRRYAPRVFSWVDPDPDYGGKTLLSSYLDELQGSPLQRLQQTYDAIVEPALMSGLTVSIDMAGSAGIHQQNLGVLLAADGFPIKRAEIADLNDVTLIPHVALRDAPPDLRAELTGALSEYKQQPYRRADGRLTYRNGRDEEVTGWAPIRAFSRWVANDVMSVLLGELDRTIPGHSNWLREKTRNAFFAALERRRPIIEAYHNGKPGSADDAFLDLLRNRERSRHWKSLSEQMFRQLHD